MGVDKKKILIVEDERLSAKYLKILLEEAGYSVVGTVESGEEAVSRTHTFSPDLILMDIILKGRLSGCEAALKIKQTHKTCKIIFVTAYCEDEMIKYAQEAQAEAYLLKPYRPDELLATIAVVLSHERRLPFPRKEEIALAHGFTFDLTRGRLMKKGKEIPLPEYKRKLVELLATNVNTTVSHAQICQAVWGESRPDSTLRSMISRIKQRLGTDLITSVSGIGYMIKSP